MEEEKCNSKNVIVSVDGWWLHKEGKDKSVPERSIRSAQEANHWIISSTGQPGSSHLLADSLCGRNFLVYQFVPSLLLTPPVRLKRKLNIENSLFNYSWHHSQLCLASPSRRLGLAADLVMLHRHRHSCRNRSIQCSKTDWSTKPEFYFILKLLLRRKKGPDLVQFVSDLNNL